MQNKEWEHGSGKLENEINNLKIFQDELRKINMEMGVPSKNRIGEIDYQEVHGKHGKEEFEMRYRMEMRWSEVKVYGQEQTRKNMCNNCLLH